MQVCIFRLNLFLKNKCSRSDVVLYSEVKYDLIIEKIKIL